MTLYAKTLFLDRDREVLVHPRRRGSCSRAPFSQARGLGACWAVGAEDRAEIDLLSPFRLR